MNTATDKVTVDSSIVPKLREWFAAGQGARRWVSAEIGNPRPDMFTPADNTTPPHWAYPLANSQVLDPSVIVVETFTERLRFRGRLKAYYWGMGLAPATEAKAKRMLLAGESFHWEYDGAGMAQVLIGPMVESPFTF